MLNKILSIFYIILNINYSNSLQIGINTNGKSYYNNEIQTGNGFNCATFPKYNPTQLPYQVDYPTQALFNLETNINPIPVQNQNNPAQCNSCYAFAITSALEILGQYQYNITDHRPLNPLKPLPLMKQLSAQQIIDCYNRLPTNQNCVSGDIYNAVNYVISLNSTSNAGLCANDDYTYQASQLPSCQFSNGKCPNNTNPYYIDFTGGSEQFIETMNFNARLLKAYLTYYGPVIVGIDMPAAFKYYTSTSGTYTAGCGTNINSVLLITGYDFSDPNNQFWIAKTSFGTSWGNNGYINLDATNSNNVTDPYGKCGIYKYGIILPIPNINKNYT